MRFGEILQSHRSPNGRPDWENVSGNLGNIWQKIAAATDGIITPANLLDAVGLALDVAANQRLIVGGDAAMQQATDFATFTEGAKQKISGLVCDNALSLLDLADGALATKTGTRSPLGEAVDGTHDFASAMLRLNSRYQIGELGGLEIAVVAGQKVATAVPTVIRKLLKKEVHTPSIGKIGETARNAFLLAADAAEIIKTLSQIELAKAGQDLTKILSGPESFSQEFAGNATYQKYRKMYGAAIKIKRAALLTSVGLGGVAAVVDWRNLIRKK
ncbi:MAG: hypothetical protein LBM73_00155 [Candidatus Nomurabacteria bacterium]|jgi:hypothetical protein|nr:hypothetical protein [Candidatus Nomurabacteria bacterium]